MGDERWVNVQPPTVDEAQRWLREHGAAFRQDTTDSLLDGNDVALHWAAKVLAALDHIEVLSAEIDSLRATLATEIAEGERREAEIADYRDRLIRADLHLTADSERPGFLPQYKARLATKAEGVRLALSYLAEIDRKDAARPSPTEEA